ncbi:hypothetical protein KC19_3G052000 [Ceratodon purpureus]|uniref:Era-type G domain-containing protein n=1 Tax=Ceratodon purpureus TaxID=3225 RepID=A0A8T0IEZ2_CERPU|nr:hypothetical protein KC19_3G052000 [Ceratodon purpureus]
MYAVVKQLLRRGTRSGVWASPGVAAAHLERSAWSGFERFYAARSGGESGSDEEGGSGGRWGGESVAGPSGRDMVKDAEWEARDAMAQAQAMALLSAALDEAEEGVGGEGSEALVVREEDQKSLRVGVVGSPNAGKSTLTNHLVGSKVSAVSRKTNTTHKEHMGILTKGDSQLIFFDTPGLTVDIRGHPLRTDNRNRVRSAWQTAELCEALIVLVDAHRQIERPDKRVARLVEKLGNEETVSQKKILCFNKVDLVHPKRLLLPLAEEYGNYPAFDRSVLIKFQQCLFYEFCCCHFYSHSSYLVHSTFMISALSGDGVDALQDYLLDLAVPRPWEEEPEARPQRLARATALEIVRQHIFDCLHKVSSPSNSSFDKLEFIREFVILGTSSVELASQGLFF